MNEMKSYIPVERDPQPEIRQAQRVLLMVHELQKAGFQLLRINPGLAPSGCYWRCSITSAAYLMKTKSESRNADEKLVARYSTGMKNEYFGWEDAQKDDARQLAVKFIERFPVIVQESFGRDWEYVGWYVEMLGFAERGHLPIAFADWFGDAPGYLAKNGERELPFPPRAEGEPAVRIT